MIPVHPFGCHELPCGPSVDLDQPGVLQGIERLMTKLTFDHSAEPAIPSVQITVKISGEIVFKKLISFRFQDIKADSIKKDLEIVLDPWGLENSSGEAALNCDDTHQFNMNPINFLGGSRDAVIEFIKSMCYEGFFAEPFEEVLQHFSYEGEMLSTRKPKKPIDCSKMKTKSEVLRMIYFLTEMDLVNGRFRSLYGNFSVNHVQLDSEKDRPLASRSINKVAMYDARPCCNSSGLNNILSRLYKKMRT